MPGGSPCPRSRRLPRFFAALVRMLPATFTMSSKMVDRSSWGCEGGASLRPSAVSSPDPDSVPVVDRSHRAENRPFHRPVGRRPWRRRFRPRARDGWGRGRREEPAAGAGGPYATLLTSIANRPRAHAPSASSPCAMERTRALTLSVLLRSCLSLVDGAGSSRGPPRASNPAFIANVTHPTIDPAGGERNSGSYLSGNAE